MFYQGKTYARRNQRFTNAKPTFYLGKTYDSEDRGIDFRSKKRSKNDVKTNMQCEADLRPIFHHLRVDVGSMLAPKTEAKSIKHR